MKKFYTSLLTAAVGLTAFSAAALNYTVEPASGSTVESLTTVSILAPDIEAFSLSADQDPEGKIKVLKDGADFCTVTITDDALEWNRLNFGFTTPATEAGTYVLSIPAGSLIDDANGTKLPWNDTDLKFTYIIEAEAPAPTYPHDITVSPANGKVPAVTEIVLSSPKYDFDYAANQSADKVSIKKDGVDYCGVTFKDDYTNYRNMIVTPAKPLSEAGDYTVTFAAGCLSLIIQDEPTTLDQEIVIKYTVTGASAETAYDLIPTTVYPADGATINVSEYFGNISIAFDPSVKVKPEAKAVFACPEANWSKEVNINDLSHLMKGNFIVAMEGLEKELPQNGTYKLTIAEGTFGDAIFIETGAGGKANPTLEYTYNLTGIKSGGSDDEAELTSIEYVFPDTEPATLLAENSLAAFPKGTRLLFNTTNNLAVGYLRVEIEDKNALAEDKMRVLESHARRTLPEDRGVFWQDDEVPFIEFGRELILQEGHEYEFRAELYDFETPPYSRLLLGTFKAKISGTTPGYQYAAAEFVSITPDPQTHEINSVEDGKFTITFTDYVQLDLTRSAFPTGQMAEVPITENDVTYSDDHKSMTIVIPEDVINMTRGSLAVSLYVTDAKGRAVFAGTDAGADSYFSFTYTCYLGSHDLTIEPEEGEITELKDIFISCPEGPTGGMIQYAYSPKKITVRNLSGETIFATFPNNYEVVEFGKNDDGQYPTKIKMSLEEAITAPGQYVVYIPAAFFNLGSEFESEGCKQTFVSYTINGEVTDQTVYDFKTTKTSYKFNDDATEVKVTLQFPGEVQINYDVANNITLEDAEGKTVEGANISNDYDWDDLTLWYLVIKHEFDAGKTYNVVVPQGTFGDGEWGNDPMLQYNCGHANPAFKVEISTPAGVENVSVDANERLDVYNLQGMLLISDADADQIASLPAGIYIIGGKKVTVK